jgi:AcrR family transcriptional regulator
VPLNAVTAATGLHKPSVYAAFGGKRGLYLAALDAYVAEAGARMSDVLSREPFRDALRAFFDVDLEFFCGRDGVRGCFLISTASDAASDDPQIRARVEKVFDGMRQAMRARVSQAIEAGDLRAATNADAITDLIAATHIALSVEARAGVSRRDLEGRVHRFLDFIAPVG